MSVKTPHPEFAAIIARWERCRDAARGTDAIKAGKDKYLPPIDSKKMGAPTDEYSGYQERALFYGVTERTVSGLVGIMLENAPIVEAPERVEEVAEMASPSGQPLSLVVRQSLIEAVSVGRLGLLVDAPPPKAGANPAPWIAIYRAEDIVNWRQERIGDRLKTTMVVLRECRQEEDPDDPFVRKDVDRYRVLWLGTKQEAEQAVGQEAPVPFSLGEDLIYFQEVYEKGSPAASGKPGDMEDNWVVVDRVVPRRQGGQTFSEIPFVFVNAADLETKPGKPPLSDLVDVNISHYQNSADLEEGLHVAALPTPYAVGANLKGAMWLGPRSGLVTENKDAKIGFLEFTGTGLTKLLEVMKDKERQMAVLGARLLEEPKAGVESADAIGLRFSGERSVVRTIAENMADAFTQALRYVSDWFPGSESQRDSISVQIMVDLDALRADPIVLAGLWTTYVQGGMSFSTFFYNLKRARLVPKDRTEDEEKELIAMGGPGRSDLGVPDDEGLPRLNPRQTDDQPEE